MIIKLVEDYVHDRFLPRHKGSHAPSSGECACVMFVSSISPAYSGLLFRIVDGHFNVRARCYACVHTRDLGFKSHPKDYGV